MSYANGTTHYNLPQTVGTDKRDWADPNQAFADIDAAIYGAVQDTAQAALDIDALEGRMDTAEQGISTNAGNIAGLDTRLTTAEGAITSQGTQITDTRQDLEDMICAFNEASATSTHAYAIGDYFIYNDVLYRAIQAIAIGDTIVPDTNCTTTNVSSELLDLSTLKGKVVNSVVGDGVKTVVQLLTTLLDTTSFDVANHRYALFRGMPSATSRADIADLVWFTVNDGHYVISFNYLHAYVTETHINDELDIFEKRWVGDHHIYTARRLDRSYLISDTSTAAVTTLDLSGFAVNSGNIYAIVEY